MHKLPKVCYETTNKYILTKLHTNIKVTQSIMHGCHLCVHVSQIINIIVLLSVCACTYT